MELRGRICIELFLRMLTLRALIGSTETKSSFYFSDTYGPTVTYSKCTSTYIGLHYHSSGADDAEGGDVFESEFSDSNIGIYIEWTNQEPGAFISKNTIKARERGVVIKNRKLAMVNDNLFDSSLSTGSTFYQDILLQGTDESVLLNNRFIGNTAVSVERTGIRFSNSPSGSGSNVIFGNSFEFDEAGVSIDSGCLRNRIMQNNFVNTVKKNRDDAANQTIILYDLI